MAKNRVILLMIVGQCIAAILLVWVVNFLVEFSIAETRERALARDAVGDSRFLSSEVASLENTAANLRNRVRPTGQLQVPSAEDFKDLTSRYKLRIRRMEKQTRTDKSVTPRRETYSIICLGSLVDDITFLRDLETSYIVQSDNIVLQRYNDDGSLVALGLTLEVREP